MARIIQTADLIQDAKLGANEQDWIYNGLDCCVTLEILHELLGQADESAWNTYNFSRSLQGPILEMTMRGFLVDQQARNRVLNSTKHDIKILGDNLTEIIKEGIGLDLNWRSPAQLKRLFYEILDLKPIRKRNANGIMAPTVNREALEKLEIYLIAEPICHHLLALRDLDKRRQFLETGIDPDGRLRTSLNIAGTDTGRLSSSLSDMGTGGNLQNVDRELRSICVSDKGKKFANLDLEQADARNVGAICWELFIEKHGAEFAGAYLNACESGDLHTNVCRMAWTDKPWTDDPVANRAIADVIAYRQDSFRQLSKKLGHGTNYYGTPATMAKHTKVAVALIKDFQVRYFGGFPCIPEWHNYVRNEIRTSGVLTTLFGRRRMFHGRAYDDTTLRAAIAHSPQSMTGDEINTGIIKLFRANRVELMIQVHDNVVIQYDEDREEEIIPWAMETLRTTLRLKGGRDFTVPVDCKVGWNWADEEYNKDGTVSKNAGGLAKWKGKKDNRSRPEYSGLSLKSLLLK
jgi:DNA polymerase I-like protein with 3'-5' exonuclease and polymerase domains